MAMSSGSAGGGMQATPNVTPMIDVMLVLLIIFMVVTPMLLAGFNADPPKAINLRDHPEDADNDHVLGIDKDGKLLFRQEARRGGGHRAEARQHLRRARAARTSCSTFAPIRT